MARAARKRALLVYPRCPDTFWSFKYAIRFISKKALNPPLGLLTVAAMLPGEWEKKLIDMNVTQLKDEHLRWADLVFISAMAIQRVSVREVLDRCRAQGVPIVAGGPLFTANHDQYREVDHLVLNEAEVTLPRFLEDLEAGKAQQIYTSTTFPALADTPVPLWGLTDMKRYACMNIQYSRGCPFKCEFCDITTLYGKKSRTKDKSRLLEELEALFSLGWRGDVFFVDDNFIGNKKKLKGEVLPAVIDWMKKRKYPFQFGTEASIDLADDEELMGLMARAGFESVFVGLETPDNLSLKECNKYQNMNRDLVASVKKIQGFGLDVKGGFIVGFDNDSPDIFERQIEFVQKSRIITAMVGMLNAPRGSELYERLRREGRVLEEMSGDNTDFSTNIIPRMGYEKLAEGYKKIISTIYSPGSFYERVKGFLADYKPLKTNKRRLPLRSMWLHRGYYIKAPLKTMLLLGIKDRARRYYWKLLFWSLFTRPRLLPRAIAYSVYGFHFRQIFRNHV